ncbi:uncharacterized protein L969DRAFT_48473 [Mixia osmundae IAM 14324]|uniref:Uncharacterized protein n=1 Tax=Mixia osmundae (strain CBS 9802 / IAM 14324 / JCM 22182 / KY 12970) TaxID=764103 RepID=G7DVM7_MIXOS|nr:uncharacterized protein L969DRAFT_48473 [Mixia osmundae IAM 14324]KEI39519.1 hypothetical protein L969DRAFT_48473 [Mixia osmundae IAM 14324]GAA94637.1 hypothetical protein E5Q_01289 [Mixia osmundae IAM 14324]
MRTRPGIGGHRQEHSFYYPSSSPASSPFEMRYLDSQLEYPTSAMTLATASTAQTYAIALFSLLIMVLIVKFQRDNATLQTDSSVPKTHSQGILPSATVTDDESKKRRQHFVQVYCRTKKALQDLPYLARYASVNQMVAYCLNKPIPTLDECSFEEPMTVLAQAVETPTLTIPAIVLWSPIASSKEQHEDAVRFPYSSSRTQDAALLRPNEQYCPRSPVEKTARPMVVFKRRFSSLRMSRQISAPLPASPSPVVPDLPTDVELSRCSSGSQSTELLDSPLDVQSREPFCDQRVAATADVSLYAKAIISYGLAKAKANSEDASRLAGTVCSCNFRLSQAADQPSHQSYTQFESPGARARLGATNRAALRCLLAAEHTPGAHVSSRTSCLIHALAQ